MYKKIKNKLISIIAQNKNKKLEHKWRAELKNDDFSIICSSCIGGVIYNRLGKQFLSPTINLFFTQGDFIKFACKLKHYIEQDLVFVKSDKSFPVAKLDDITIYFNHAKSEQDAENDWNRRKNRINYDNIYLIFYYKDNYTIENIKEIEKAECKRKILLTSKKIDLPYAYYIELDKHKRPNYESFLDKDLFGIRTFEKQWNFVNWLNGSDN